MFNTRITVSRGRILILTDLIVVAGFILASGYFLQVVGNECIKEERITIDSVDLGAETYINRDGQEWGPLPIGKYDFNVSSAEGVWPKFIEGEIDPPDVHVGDIQKFRIVVQSSVGVTSVIANIETDNGTTTVPLVITKEET